MRNQQPRGEAPLKISIYKRGGNKASLVFRHRAVLFRITSIEDANVFVKQLTGYLDDLRKGIGKPYFVMQLQSPRSHQWVVEIKMNVNHVMKLSVWRYEGINRLVPCFVWNGDQRIFNASLSAFSVRHLQ